MRNFNICSQLIKIYSGAYRIFISSVASQTKKCSQHYEKNRQAFLYLCQVHHKFIILHCSIPADVNSTDKQRILINFTNLFTAYSLLRCIVSLKPICIAPKPFQRGMGLEDGLFYICSFPSINNVELRIIVFILCSMCLFFFRMNLVALF